MLRDSRLDLILIHLIKTVKNNQVNSVFSPLCAQINAEHLIQTFPPHQFESPKSPPCSLRHPSPTDQIFYSAVGMKLRFDFWAVTDSCSPTVFTIYTSIKSEAQQSRSSERRKKKSSVWTWGSLRAPQFMVTSGKAAQSKYTPADSKQRVMLETTPEPKKSLLRMEEKLQKILWLTDFKKNSWIQETFRNRSTGQCYKKSMVLYGDNVNVNKSWWTRYTYNQCSVLINCYQ